MTIHTLKVQDLTKVFATNRGPVTAVDEVNFELSGDQFFTMLGPSGCGKTTTLRMIAGLETITSGTILFDDQNFSRFSSFQRNIGMVFQSYALFPHMTVYENAAYGLRIRKLSESQIKERVERILKLIGLDELAARHPADLSGGQQQRVSIARALVYDPGMLLLDEPLANLDAKLRVDMRQEIRRIQKDLGIMTLYVTHDQEEAMSISDQIAVFNFGKLMQVGKPKDIYTDPVSLFVADFIGKANLFPVHINGQDANSAQVTFSNGPSMALDRVYTVIPEEDDQFVDGFDGMVMMRPEHVELGAPDEGLPCTVKHIEFLGGFIRYFVESPATDREVIVDARREFSGLSEGQSASLKIQPAVTLLFRKGQAT
jgi:iron(III) transport system ATP-binding protein